MFYTQSLSYHVLEQNFVLNKFPRQHQLLLSNVRGVLYVGDNQHGVGVKPLEILGE